MYTQPSLSRNQLISLAYHMSLLPRQVPYCTSVTRYVLRPLTKMVALHHCFAIEAFRILKGWSGPWLTLQFMNTQLYCWMKEILDVIGHCLSSVVCRLYSDLAVPSFILCRYIVMMVSYSICSLMFVTTRSVQETLLSL